ncbi:sensor histidine kinase [Actinacidiphila alni]|uniref:sensor histidine kinase n=1 Tax=Actinacidiphila alni TaxID=380248 RepID=UPI003F4CC375
MARVRAEEGRSAGVAAIFGVAAVGEVLGRASGSGASGRYVVAVALLALATTVPAGFVRRAPVVAAVTAAAAAAVSLTPFHRLTVAGGCALLLVLHEAAREAPPALPAALAAPFLVLALAHPGPPAVLLAALAPTAAWSGVARRARTDARAHRAARAELTGSLLEHTARGERARIARELHDVVAHHISMVAVQAETARLTTPGMPHAGAAKLSAIGDTARAALTEMRRLLGVLREDAAPDEDRLQPQPGLSQLIELLDEARDTSGTGARLIVRGAATDLDPGVELAAYRIVQEALTNARRHAPGAAVDVELHYAGDTLALRVRDNGPGPPPPAHTGTGAGLGLLGMRERAAAVGGDLRTGPAPGGGFLVETVLPVNSGAEHAA